MKAVISGATRGIGRAIAEKLAIQGFDLVLMARNEKALTLCKLELSKPNITVEYVAIDFSKESYVEVLAQNSSLFEKTTLLVNNLGIYSMQNAADIELVKLKDQMQLNLYSAISLTQNILDSSGSALKNIVNIASVMSIKATSFAADYSISKHAFKAWNDALREELRSKNMKVSAIFPGSVNTSSWDGIEADRSEMIQAEDIAECVSCILKMKSRTLLEEIHISPQIFVP
ncbi:MAG: short-subunit dehydrogenase [Vicingaceae bacterium]|jgi:short-subunit dehydrogenase